MNHADAHFPTIYDSLIPLFMMSNSPVLDVPQNVEPQHVDIRVRLDGTRKYVYEMLEEVKIPLTNEKLNSLIFQTKCEPPF